MADDGLRAHVEACVIGVLTANAGQPVAWNEILGADLNYNSGSVISLIAQVEARLNQPPGHPAGPFWLPKTPKQRKLVNASVGGFTDWVEFQCRASAVAPS